MNFDVSEISIMPVKPNGTLLGFASFVLGRGLYIGGVAIHSDALNRGTRLVYPTKRLQNNQDIPLVHPIHKIVGDEIQRAVIDKWESLIR